MRVVAALIIFLLVSSITRAQQKTPLTVTSPDPMVLRQELKLTDRQVLEMQRIEARFQEMLRDSSGTDVETLRQIRDDMMRSVLTPRQKARWEKLGAAPVEKKADP